MKSAIILQDVNRNRNQMHVLKIDPIDQMVTSRRKKNVYHCREHKIKEYDDWCRNQ